jgi:hypothetical protein
VKLLAKTHEESEPVLVVHNPVGKVQYFASHISALAGGLFVDVKHGTLLLIIGLDAILSVFNVPFVVVHDAPPCQLIQRDLPASYSQFCCKPLENPRRHGPLASHPPPDKTIIHVKKAG